MLSQPDFLTHFEIFFLVLHVSFIVIVTLTIGVRVLLICTRWWLIGLSFAPIRLLFLLTSLRHQTWRVLFLTIDYKLINSNSNLILFDFWSEIEQTIVTRL